MAKKKKKTSKKESDFYLEEVNFSDDPEDSFYATSDDEEGSLAKRDKGKTSLFGFYTWELLVLIGQLLLLIYLGLVLFGLAPLL